MLDTFELMEVVHREILLQFLNTCTRLCTMYNSTIICVCGLDKVDEEEQLDRGIPKGHEFIQWN